ncbi:MAG TPA: pectinesterase family protein [Allosphingosinicella sp.]|nr:pectinesterase family protein [Allosphingosinicella sp.]
MLGLAGLAIAAAAPLPRRKAEPKWNAVVAANGGAGTAPTLGAALDLAERAGGRPFRILVEPGTYREKLHIRSPNVTIEGRGPESVLVFGAAAGLVSPDGSKWGTGRSATLTVEAADVTLRNLDIRNDFDYLAARAVPGAFGSQAVALSLAREADRVRVERCRLESWQDTLYVQTHALFTGCTIAGVVDFIFGGGASFFDRCTIVTRHVPGAVEQGYVAAPSTPKDQRFGLVFSGCRLEREPGVPDHSAWLGRPWRAGGNMDLTGEAAFLRCWMDAHIHNEGWTSMGYAGPDGVRHMLAPHEARLVEYGSMGPGAGPAGVERRLLSAQEAASFTMRNVLGNWIR